MNINMYNLDDMVDELKKLEMLKKNYEEKVSNMKDEIKNIMKEEGVLEVRTEKYIIRNKPVTSNRFDTNRFKNEHHDLYEAYTVASTTERFTVN